MVEHALGPGSFGFQTNRSAPNKGVDVKEKDKLKKDEKD